MIRVVEFFNFSGKRWNIFSGMYSEWMAVGYAVGNLALCGGRHSHSDDCIDWYRRFENPFGFFTYSAAVELKAWSDRNIFPNWRGGKKKSQVSTINHPDLWRHWCVGPYTEVFFLGLGLLSTGPFLTPTLDPESQPMVSRERHFFSLIFLAVSTIKFLFLNGKKEKLQGKSGHSLADCIVSKGDWDLFARQT